MGGEVWLGILVTMQELGIIQVRKKWRYDDRGKGAGKECRITAAKTKRN